jgi:SOS-response transcriptional repressor LexA
MAEDISIPDNFKTKGADFAVRISGHSMEPRYRDGDVLLVQECESVENGELGIFVLDGSGYFKIFGGDRLISINPDFADIPLSDFGEAACCGKVIGKLRKK